MSCHGITFGLALVLEIAQTTYVGDKVSDQLRAIGSDANSTIFAWSNVSAVRSPPSTDPNLANRTLLRSQTVTVTCTMNGAVSKSIVLGGGSATMEGLRDPVSWGTIRSWYR